MISTALAATLRDLGLPPVMDVRPLRARNGLEDTAIYFDAEQYIVLRRAVDSWGSLRIERELAVLPVLQDAGFPTPQGYRVLRHLGAPVALFPPLPGAAGAAVLVQRQDLMQDVFFQLGAALARLLETQPTERGFLAREGRFARLAPTQGAEWLREARHHLSRAVSAGAGLGEVGRRLLGLVEEACPALDANERLCIVHRTTDPFTIRLVPRDGKASLTGFFEWGHAIAGDPLAEWARALFVPAEPAAWVVRGFGPSRVVELFEEEGAVARLRAYTAASLLFSMTQVVREPSTERAMRLAEICRRAESLLQPDFIQQRMDELVESASSPPSAELPAPDRRAAAHRRAIDMLGFVGMVSRRGALAWVNAVSCLEPEASEAAQQRAEATLDGWLCVGGRLDGALEPVDREAWRTALAGRVLAKVDASRGNLGLVAARWALHATETLGMSLDGMACDSVERFIHQVETIESEFASLPNREQFLHALLGLAALAYLERLTGVESSEVRALLEERLAEGWYGIEPMILPTGLRPWRETIEELRKGSWEHLEIRDWTGPVLEAIAVLEDRLPATPAEILHALALTPAAPLEG